MAIYYFDPHTVINGTGTWASPFSLATNNTSTFASGDELRIKGVALTDLLTGSTYSGSLTYPHQIQATGIGTASAVGDVYYIEETEAFFSVYGVVGADQIQISSNQAWKMLPVSSTASSATWTLKKVDIATYKHSISGTIFYLIYGSDYDNITISDCWVDVGGTPTRVTDGSVKTLIRSSSTGSSQYLYMTPLNMWSSGWTVNMQNSSVLSARGTTTKVYVMIDGTNHTMSFGQLESSTYSPGYASNSNVTTNGGFGFNKGLRDSTISVKVFCGSIVGLMNDVNSLKLANNTFNFDLCISQRGSQFSSSFSYYPELILTDLTVNVVDLIVYDFCSISLNIYTPYSCFTTNSTLNVTGNVDTYGSNFFVTTGSNARFAFLITDCVGSNTYDISSATFYSNRRANTNPALFGRVGYVSGGVSSGTGVNRGITDFAFPTTSIPAIYDSGGAKAVSEETGWATNSSGSGGIFSSWARNPGASAYQPIIYNARLPSSSSWPPSNSYMFRMQSVNYLRPVCIRITFEDNSDPIEAIFLTAKNSWFSTGGSANSLPTLVNNLMECTKDASTYRTSGPSLKMKVTSTYSVNEEGVYPAASLTWGNGYIKHITIPVTGSTSTTVAGYIRTDNSTMATADCTVLILDQNYDVVTSQDMTSAAYNAWESFSLNFTPSYTGEWHIAIRNLYPIFGKSYWLDDLTVS